MYKRQDIISAACNVGVNETLRVLVENTEADRILLAKEKLTLGSRMDDIAHQDVYKRQDSP